MLTLDLLSSGRVHAAVGGPLGVVGLGLGQQVANAVAAVDQTRVIDGQEVRGDVMGNVGTQAIDQLANLPGDLGIPHRPSVVALSVSHGVVGPCLEGFAGLVFRPWHVGRDFTPRLLGSKCNDLPRRGLGGSLGRRTDTGTLIGILMIGILICRIFFRP